MFKYIAGLAFLFVLIIAEPITRQSLESQHKTPSLEDLELSFSLVDEDPSPRALQRSRRFITLSGLSFIGTLIQHKISAITIVITAIKWIATNVHALIFGGLVSFAFCKLTGKCQLGYNQVVPYRETLGPEYAMAENLFERAVDRYKRENGEF